MALYTFRTRAGRLLQRALLRNRHFTLISNDCWGAEVYKFYNLLWNTPCIGLYLVAEDYLRLLENPQRYLDGNVVFVAVSRHEAVNQHRAIKPHPIGLVGGDVEIQFLHYHSEQEAREKWARRCARIVWDNLIAKFDGSKDGATAELVQQFDQLPYPKKLTLLKESQEGIKSAVVVPHYTTDGLLQFAVSMQAFDLTTWLNTGKLRTGSLYKIARKLLVLE
ncbi:DUF1919 domain-containing protein [Hymenobacter sp. NBH84]|uniref:DUF1919 domain-containing protein n=1 Tax=Hymenobacter sp. NBH84 TaxID=2596915 RepID=UPI001626868C|nr:DUF1919 domain-containing protein [Hymenobacter sp. NBH84]QNE39493.1 DUF1919 domain-containing protein [Hymenobacter sp. NBH84]